MYVPIIWHLHRGHIAFDCKTTHNLCSSLYLLLKATLNILELSVVSFLSFSEIWCRRTPIVSVCQNHKCNTRFFLTRHYSQARLLLTYSKQEMTQQTLLSLHLTVEIILAAETSACHQLRNCLIASRVPSCMIHCMVLR